MNSQLNAVIPSMAILGVFAVIALYLTLTRSWADRSRTQFRSAVQITVIAIMAQAAHFAEELLTGFHERFPELFGINPMSLKFFVTFNIAWLVIWSASVWGITRRYRAALFPLWFLSIGCVANGVAHPALSVLIGGYFPGLLTSPVVGILGILLMRRLLFVTHAGDTSIDAA